MTEAQDAAGIPLAARLRPRTIADVIGQSHLLAEGKPLAAMLDRGQLVSMLFWGPPGCGKTTLASLLADAMDMASITLRAVDSGVKEIRAALDEARMRRASGQQTLVFVDEVHRFNKAQQDVFLPYIEAGDILFVGATTENPSFELNSALLSRLKVFRLEAHDDDSLRVLARRALAIQVPAEDIAEDAIEALVGCAGGDARRLLNTLELALAIAGEAALAERHVHAAVAHEPARFDKGGDLFHEQISALHKSVRGSDPDASLYWLARMLQGGCDPRYIGRRLVRMASEDIGNADVRALTLALDALATWERLGSPEGDLALAQATVYLAVAPKSNAVYTAFGAAMKLAQTHPAAPVPMHLRNAPTRLMKAQGMGAGYRYAHDEPDAFAAGANYLPEGVPDAPLYQPVPRGLEIRIAEKMERLRSLNAQARDRKPT